MAESKQAESTPGEFQPENDAVSKGEGTQVESVKVEIHSIETEKDETVSIKVEIPNAETEKDESIRVECPSVECEKNESISSNETEPENNNVVTEEQKKDVKDDGEEKKGKQSNRESPKPKRGPSGSPSTSRHPLDKDRISTNLTADQRKHKAEDLRKKKIGDLKKKEDDKRKAVLERKKKIEEEERRKADALLKKLRVSPTPQSKRLSSAPSRRSASTSNLLHLKKTQLVSHDIDVSSNKKRGSFSSDGAASTGSGKSDKRPPARPSSAMERRRPGSFSDPTTSSSSKSAKVSSKPSSPDSSKTTKPTVKQQAVPKVRQSLGAAPQRPATALGVRTRPESQRKSSGPVKATTPVQPLPTKPLRPTSATRPKEMQKSKSTGSVLSQKDTKPKPPHKDTRPKQSTSPIGSKSKVSTEPKQKPPSPSGSTTKSITESKPKPKSASESNKSKASSDAKPKTTKAVSSNEQSSESAGPKKAGTTNEEEAKRLLAERRRQAKEEAEKKALADKAQQEEEQRRKEEEARRLEEEFLKEQQRQEEMLEQLKRDEEERQRIAQEEKEKKEKEEMEKLEAEKRQREEELNRKTKEELERRAKEREKTRQEEEAERNERKKRIEAIMAKVQRPVTPTFQGDSSEIVPSENGVENSGQGSPPDDENSESAKEKADRIMQKIKANGNLSPSDPAVNEENRTIETDEGSDINVLQVTENNLFTVQVGQEVESKSYTITTSDTQNSDDIEFEFNSGLAEADQQALQQLEIEQQKHFLDGDNKEQVNITVNSDETISNGSIVSNNIGKGMPAPENTDKEAEQQNLWDAAEQAMKESNDSVLNSLEQKGLGPSDDNDANKESQLWQVAEGRLELEECF